MAKMIPDEIHASASASEKIIFDKLKHAPQAREWVVFHSKYTENPKHHKRPLEIDFIILIPDYFSVICLEAKGGQYNIRRGQWFNRYTNRPLPSPLEQAKDAMYALKKEFEHSHFRKKSLLSLGCAVGFTDGKLPNNVPKHLALMIDSRTVRDPDRLVNRLSTHADEMRLPNTIEELSKSLSLCLAQEFLHELQTDLEANMEIGPEDPKTIRRADLETRLPQLLRLTAEQVSSLDIAEENPRCAINGAAGTGKTVLAMELAKRRCEAGQTVALLCSNPNLSHRFERWAKELSGDHPGEVVAGTPATLPSYVFREDSTLSDQHRQRLAAAPQLEESLKLGDLDTNWSSFVAETVNDLGQQAAFDYLIVDEAQNLCDDIFLQLMDALLKGGLADGRFTMFGDFTNQNIVSHRRTSDGRDALKTFIESRDLPSITLKTNCRNTHQIAEKVAQLTDIESPPMSGVHGPEVQIEYFKSDGELGELLDYLVGDLRKRNFRSRQIILLSNDGDGFNDVGQYGGWQLSNIREVKEVPRTDSEVVILNDSLTEDTLRYSNVYDFQGLESEVAILVIPVMEDQSVTIGGVTLPREQHLRKILYTGMSRAKAMLIIVAHESYESTLELRQRIQSPPA